MAYVRAKLTAIQDAATAAGIRSSIRGISLALDIPVSTLHRVLMHGAAPTPLIESRLMRGLGVPFEQIFELVEDDDEPESGGAVGRARSCR